MIRVFLLILILALILLSIGGYIAVSLDLLPAEIAKFYGEHFSFVTGIASVIGLLAFASTRKIKSTDFESEEIAKFKSLMKTAEELDKIEQNKSRTAKDLQDLERKKKVMEISVKKAGLVLFYKDQEKKYTDVVLDKIENDVELKKAIEELTDASSRLAALSEEIESDENVEIIREIFEANERKSGVVIDDPVLIFLNKFSERAVQSVNSFFRI